MYCKTNLYTVVPLLKGHLQDLPWCLLNKGCPLNTGRLYGTHLAVEYELLDENGNGVTIGERTPGRFTDNFYVYRWIDAIGEGKAFDIKDAAAVFHEKTDEGLGGFKPEKEVDLFVPASLQTNFTWTGSSDFTTEMLSKNKVLFEYNPDLSDVEPDKVVQKPITLEVNKGLQIGQIFAQYVRPLEFDDYWLPSTDTLNLPTAQRNSLFNRIFDNKRVTQFYLGALASRGPTVNLPDLANNILQSDSMTDFYGEIARRQPDRNVEVIPWFEGTGRIAGNVGLSSEYRNSRAIAYTDFYINDKKEHVPSGDIHYIDLFTDGVGWSIFLKYVKAFVDKYKPMFNFKSIIVDDHFGIAAKKGENLQAMRQRFRDKNPQQPDNRTDTEIDIELVKLVNTRVRQLSNVLSLDGIDLSISVNPFNFNKVSNNGPLAGHTALSTNFHDVAQWIEEGSITGEINVQIYREEPESVKRDYFKLLEALQTHLDGKSKDYIDKFPEIAVSLAAEGTNWRARRDQVKGIIDYIRGNDKETHDRFVRGSDGNPIIGTYHGREVKIRISGFDGDDFHDWG